MTPRHAGFLFNSPWMKSQGAPLRAVFAAALLLCASGVAHAQRRDHVARELQGIGIDNTLGAQLPLDVTVRDENGVERRLGDFFSGTKPVMLTLGYYRCPMLCGLLLNAFLDVAGDLEWSIGTDFEVVTLSFDPNEGPELAAKKKDAYIKAYGREGAADGWHFLTADQAAITQVTTAFGFHYRWNEERQEWGHSTGVFVCTPTGKLARLLNGLPTDAPTMRLALIEAGEGAIGTTWDNFMMFCYHFDGDRGSYAVAAVTIMQGAGALTVLALLALWLLLRRRRGRRESRAVAPHSPQEKPRMGADESIPLNHEPR